MSQYIDEPTDKRQVKARRVRGYGWMDYVLAPEYIEKNNKRSQPSLLGEVDFPSLPRRGKVQKAQHD